MVVRAAAGASSSQAKPMRSKTVVIVSGRSLAHVVWVWVYMCV